MAEQGPDAMTNTLASNPVLAEVAQWPGVSLHRGNRGELSVRVGRVEIGHMHGASMAHFGFPRPLWTELVRDEIVEHHPLNMPGWAARRIVAPSDVKDVVELFRLNYERVRARSARRENDSK